MQQTAAAQNKAPAPFALSPDFKNQNVAPPDAPPMRGLGMYAARAGQSEGRRHWLRRFAFFAGPAIQNPAALLVLNYLAMMANDGGKCWPAQRTIALDLGLSLKMVAKALKRLDAQGLISRKQRLNHSTVYKLNMSLMGDIFHAVVEQSEAEQFVATARMDNIPAWAKMAKGPVAKLALIAILCRNDGRRDDHTRAKLAKFVGTSTKSITRAMQHLSKSGVLKTFERTGQSYEIGVGQGVAFPNAPDLTADGLAELQDVLDDIHGITRKPPESDREKQGQKQVVTPQKPGHGRHTNPDLESKSTINTRGSCGQPDPDRPVRRRDRWGRFAQPQPAAQDENSGNAEKGQVAEVVAHPIVWAKLDALGREFDHEKDKICGALKHAKDLETAKAVATLGISRLIRLAEKLDALVRSCSAIGQSGGAAEKLEVRIDVTIARLKRGSAP